MLLCEVFIYGILFSGLQILLFYIRCARNVSELLYYVLLMFFLTLDKIYSLLKAAPKYSQDTMYKIRSQHRSFLCLI